MFCPMEGCDVVEGRLWQAWGLSMSKSLVRVLQSEVWVVISRYSPPVPLFSLHTRESVVRFHVLLHACDSLRIPLPSEPLLMICNIRTTA